VPIPWSGDGYYVRRPAEPNGIRLNLVVYDMSLAQKLYDLGTEGFQKPIEFMGGRIMITGMNMETWGSDGMAIRVCIDAIEYTGSEPAVKLRKVEQTGELPKPEKPKLPAIDVIEEAIMAARSAA